MFRALMYGLIAYLAYRAYKHFCSPLQGPGGREFVRGTPPGEAELVRDPQCGTYFLRQQGVKGKSNGHVLHFCSEECRKKYADGNKNHNDLS